MTTGLRASTDDGGTDVPRESPRPTIDDVKALQAKLGVPDHVVWSDEQGFVIAHTDEERATIDLHDCPLHQWLTGLGGPPEAMDLPGYYLAAPHRPDAYSEDYGRDPWDFWPIGEPRWDEQP